MLDYLRKPLYNTNKRIKNSTELKLAITVQRITLIFYSIIWLAFLYFQCCAFLNTFDFKLGFKAPVFDNDYIGFFAGWSCILNLPCLFLMFLFFRKIMSRMDLIILLINIPLGIYAFCSSMETFDSIVINGIGFIITVAIVYFTFKSFICAIKREMKI